jgi:hypothetical protein
MTLKIAVSKNIEIDGHCDGAKNCEQLSILAMLFTSLERKLVAQK